MSERRLRLLLVDDHKVVRLGLSAVFQTAEQFEVVGEAGTAAEGIAEARRCQPDVVIMDVRLPDGSGIEACRDIRAERPETSVLILTGYGDEDAVASSILAGASGYVLKSADPNLLIEAVEKVGRGGSLLDPEVVGSVLHWMRQRAEPTPADPLDALSEQERRILLLIAEGKTNRQIGVELSLSEHTIKTYVSQILKKLSLSRRSEAAAFIARREYPTPKASDKAS